MTTRSENTARRQLRAALAPVLSLSGCCDRLVVHVLQATPESVKQRPTFRIQAGMLARVAKDLRACAVLTSMGYSAQAWTVASALFELAYDIGFIWSDDARAVRWNTWPDAEHRPWSVYDAVHATTRRLELPKGIADDRYRTYQQLCLPKHGHPIVQREHGILRGTDALHLQIDTYASPKIVRQCQRGLIYAMHSATTASWVYAQLHVGTGATLRRVIRVVVRLRDLQREVLHTRPVSGV